MPTTPYDAKGMMISAIRDDGPVICLEHRWLYDVTDVVPVEPYTIPLGEPRVVVPGNDVTVVATSWMTVEARMASELLQQRGIGLEVIDVRTVSPLNINRIAESARRTGRVIVADYDWVNCGFGAEVSARLGEECFGELAGPIKRLGFAHAPCPTTRPLENLFYPNARHIVRAAEELVGCPPMPLENVQFYNWNMRFKGPF